MRDQAALQRWLADALRSGRAAQPSDTNFPRRAWLSADDAIPEPVALARRELAALVFDFGGAWVFAPPVDDAERWFFVYVATDGDDGLIEAFDATGGHTASALFDGDSVTWCDRAVARAHFEAPE